MNRCIQPKDLRRSIGWCLLEAGDFAQNTGEADNERITRAAEWLRIRDFDPSMALEIRLAEAEQAGA